ncbi:MAG: GTP pyrophosphokinase, partial [Breznakibacter sp.]|nr:GTP pyrophosphokinase [Breznakibacter sp.]
LSFIADIRITGLDQMGIVSKITKIISEEKHVNIRALHFESFDGIFDGNITLYIPSTQDLENLIETLKKIKGVHSVMRVEKNEK